MDAATQRQNQAAEPDKSTWLSANAGSGKTRVLTDRVARLLLERVPPQNILCLTYTKAAASEMQNRLFRRLGSWAMTDDSALSRELAGLGIAGVEDRARLAEARRLFARAIETPGGLRIQTIHSFCASLLRRFPLEAGVTPHFAEMDDRAAALLRAEIVEDLAGGGDVAAVDALAAHFAGDDLSALTEAVVRHREALTRAPDETAIAGWFGLPADANEATVLETAFDGTEAALVAELLPIARTQSKTYAEFGAALAALDLEAPDMEVYRALCGLFLYASGDRQGQSKSINFPQANHGKALDAFAPVLPELHAFMDRVAAAHAVETALMAARKTDALHRFAAAFLPAYAARKERLGWLDFDDLILKTRDLLTDPAVADWVLYRLDGGLDHILVDEAQDTSPVQWQVIERLAQEFTAGKGARDGTTRTVFVVGDQKQSIYSFQGADPAEFERMRAQFREKLQGIGAPLVNLELEYSFRSSDAILRFVETVFEGQDGPSLRMDARHRAFHAELPGRVDLWPPVPRASEAEPPHWTEPLDSRDEAHHDSVLARQIAETIAATIETETIPLQDGRRRPVRAGDFLILVRRRAPLFEEIIRACKARGLPVAGADRLKLGGELAVRDLAALLAFLATQEDDLSLATVLRSPLLGWDERQLFDLATGRGGAYLWTALRNGAADWPETAQMLHDLRDDADYLRPYDLIERVLTRHDGRRRLLARLGPEAEDGIDALLSQALAYERTEVPSLTGFLTWLETEDVEVKRQLDAAGDRIRAMTVHGAKGLESPIVILPDTAKRTPRNRDEIVPLEDGMPVWKTPAGRQPDAMKAALDRARAAQDEEALRLFYVAMTRAETWLMICAAGDVGEAGQSWYRVAEAALGTLGAVEAAMPTGPGKRYAHGDWTGGASVPSTSEPAAEVELPDWAFRPAAIPERPVGALSPSDLGGAKAMPGEGGLPEEEALAFGRHVHTLLEHLPDLPPEAWETSAAALLAADAEGPPPEGPGPATAHARRVLSDRGLAPLFAGDALVECDLTAALPGLGGRRVHGTVDRLIVTDATVTAVDFKTNAVVPDRPENTPEGILRQMGAYLEALETIYPDRAVEVAVLWTAIPRLMALPHDIVRAALRNTPSS